MGRATAPSGSASAAHAGVVAQDQVTSTPAMCNPYDYEGVLLVNLTVPAENKWEPVAAPKDCQPVDYLSLIAEQTNKQEMITNPDLEFMRNRTIVLLGDSIDRE